MADWWWCRDGLLNAVGACRNFLKVNLAVCGGCWKRVGTKLLLDGSSRTGLALSYIKAHDRERILLLCNLSSHTPEPQPQTRAFGKSSFGRKRQRKEVERREKRLPSM